MGEDINGHIKKKTWILLCSVFLLVFLVGTVSAFEIDNFKYEREITFDGKLILEDELLEKYPPIEIKNAFGLGAILFEGYLSQHTDTCVQNCKSTMEIKLHEDSVLIQDVKFFTMQNKDTLIEQDIRSYQFYIYEEDKLTWAPYEIGTVMLSGIYTVKLEGEKKPSRRVDWQIESQGELLDAWAEWGNLSSDDFEDGILDQTLWNNYTTVSGANQWAEVIEEGDGGGDGFARARAWRNDDGAASSAFAYLNFTIDLSAGLENFQVINISFNISVSDNDNREDFTMRLFDGGTYRTLYSVNPSNSQRSVNGTDWWIEINRTANTIKLFNRSSGSQVGSTATMTSGDNWILNFKSHSSEGAGGGTGQPKWAYINIHDINYDLDNNIYLNSPADNYVSSILNVTFDCTAVSGDGANVTNMSLWHNGTGTWQLNQSFTIITDVSSYNYVVNSTIPTSDTLWTCEACDTDDACAFASSNRTVSSDMSAPLITIEAPPAIVNYGKVGEPEMLNVTFTDPHLDVCWYDYNGTNVTISGCTSGVKNSETFTLEESNLNITVYANDTGGNLNSSFTSWDYLVRENSNTFNSSSFETSTEKFTVGITTNGSVPANGQLIYGGTAYSSAIITNTGGNDYNLSRTIQIPTAIGTKNWRFNFTIAGSDISTSIQNQSVGAANFSFCGASPMDTPYLNFTFKDESDDSVLNATNDLTDVDFWLGDGTVTKSYINSNSTENLNYEFCFNPPNKTVIIDMVFKYASSGYPLRNFVYDDHELTNTTTEQTLYLLATADGIYSSISVIESSGNTIEGVQIIIERQFSGVWTTVGQDNTGSDGVATFWVNPNFQHRITATKTGYVSNQVTITPSQSLYTLTLQKTTGEATYSSPLEGIKWVVYPASGTIAPGSRSFNVTVTSSESNLDNCKFELVNVSDITQTLSSITSITNSSYCFLEITYLSTVDNNFFGRLSLDTLNTTGFVIVNADWKWIIIDQTDVKAWRSITSFFSDLKTIGEFGEGNEGEFSRIVVFFILMTLFLGVLIYFTGIELTSPGITIAIIWIIVLFASVGGFLTFESGSSNVNERIEQFGFFFILTLYVLNYFLTIIRRANE